jgi:hypothetical protein
MLAVIEGRTSMKSCTSLPVYVEAHYNIVSSLIQLFIMSIRLVLYLLYVSGSITVVILCIPIQLG